MKKIELRHGGYALIGNKINAQYTNCEDPMHQHNPFTEALPRLRTEGEVSQEIKRLPIYSDAERERPDHIRRMAIQRIENIIVPLPGMLELERRLTRMIYSGYSPRNPITPEWRKQIRAGYPGLNCPDGGDHIPIIRSTASGMCIWGISGGGKTVGVESALGLYPQVIVHTKYKDYCFNHQQVVWLKVDCPYDGSTRGLGMSIFETIDYICCTRHFDRLLRSRANTDAILATLPGAAAVAGVGVLVIDETQRLSVAKSGGEEKMLNFFVQLTNTVGIPVIVIGTYKIMRLMMKEFSISRKFSSQGDMIWSNLADDETNDTLIRTVWPYQWTNIRTPLTDDIKKVLYEESQGIIGIELLLYRLCQWKLIGSGKEKITPEIIRGVVRESLQFCRPALAALKTGDIERLIKYTDVMPRFDDLEQLLRESDSRMHIVGKLDTLWNREKMQRSDHDMESPLITVSKMLIEAGYDPKVAGESAMKAIGRHGSECDLKLAVPEAFRLALTYNEEKADSKSSRDNKKNKPKKTALPDDLREVAKRRKKETSVYEAFKEAGHIKPATEFFSDGTVI